MRARTLALLLALASLAMAAAPPATATSTAVGTHPVTRNNRCRIVAKAVAVRLKPKKRSTKMGIAHRGDRCVEYGGSGNWVKVRIKRSGVRGWVRYWHVDTNTHASSIPE